MKPLRVLTKEVMTGDNRATSIYSFSWGRVQHETFFQSTCSKDRHIDFTMANNDGGWPPCSVMGSHSKFCVLTVPALAKRRPRTAALQDTKELLHLVCVKLVSVQRERYIMECQAKTEACRQERSFSELDKIRWYDYLLSPKSTTIDSYV